MLFTVFGGKFKFQGQDSDLEYFFGRFDKPIRGVARGGAGGGDLADQLTLLEPGWADFAPHTTVSPHGFKKLSTPL